MRWLLAMIKHETNTFSPVPTPLERFFRGSAEPVSGDAAVALYDGTNSGLAGYLDVARETGADVTIPVAAAAWPSGPATAQTYRQLCQPVLDELARGGYDAVLLDLHGAMVTSDLEDAEGDLLRRIREIAPDIPVAVTLDMHANLYDDMVRHATVISGYHTYPHVDIHAAAVRAARIVARALKGEIRPVMAWGNRPMLPHVLRQGTHAEPKGALHRTPNADAGLSAGPTPVAGRAGELLDRAWATRADWVYHSEALQPSVARAAGIEQAPSCCWTIATTRPRAARWTTPRYWPRSCARDWTTWPSTPSMIPTPRNRPPGPAWARRSRSLGGKIQAPRCASPACRWRSRAASSWCSTACTAAVARWGAARSTTPG